MRSSFSHSNVCFAPRCNSTQVCCKDLWYLEVERPAAASRVQLVRASTHSLELCWPSVPSAAYYILEVQKIPQPPPTVTPAPPTPTPAPVPPAIAPPAAMPTLGSPIPTMSSPAAAAGSMSPLTNAGIAAGLTSGEPLLQQPSMMSLGFVGVSLVGNLLVFFSLCSYQNSSGSGDCVANSGVPVASGSSCVAVDVGRESKHSADQQSGAQSSRSAESNSDGSGAVVAGAQRDFASAPATATSADAAHRDQGPGQAAAAAASAEADIDADFTDFAATTDADHSTGSAADDSGCERDVGFERPADYDRRNADSGAVVYRATGEDRYATAHG